MTPALARLWLRAARRRPLRALTTVAMALVMCVATTASLVAADSLATLFTQDAEAEWGAVDVEARSAVTTVFEDGTGRAVAREAGDLTTRWAPRLLLPGVTLADRRTEPQTQVLGLGAEDQAFPRLTAVEGSADWLGLGGRRALVNERLARRTGLTVGATFRLVVAVPEWEERRQSPPRTVRHLAKTVRLPLTVAGIVADEGSADLHRAATVILTRDVLQRRTGLLPGRSTVLHLSARSHEADDADALVDGLRDAALDGGLAVTAVRTAALERADEEGGLFRSILLTLALLVVVAAAAAVVDLLTAAGLDRAREIAVLRSLGASTALASRLMQLEALVYALLAAGLGMALSVPLAEALGSGLADHFATLSTSRGREQVGLTLAVEPLTLVVSVGVLLGVMLLAARRAARRVVTADLDLVLRGGVPMPRRRRADRRPVVAMALGSASLGAAPGSATRGTLLFLGGTLLLAAAWLRARQPTDRRDRLVRPDQRDRPDRRDRRDRRDRLDRRYAAGGLAFALLAPAVLGDFGQGVQAGFGTLTCAGLLAVTCTCVLLSQRLRASMTRVRAYAPSGVTQAALLAAGASAQRHRERGATAMGTVAAALFVLTALAVLGNATALPAERQAGGYDVVATSVADVGADRLRELPGVADLAGLQSALAPEDAYRVEDDDGRRMTVPYPVRLVAVDQRMVLGQGFGLAAALPAYPTAGDALQEVLGNDDAVVLDRSSRPEGAQPGDEVVLDTPGGQRRLRLLAVLDTFLLNGVLVSEASFRRAAPDTGDTLVLARAVPGFDADRLATALAAAGREAGLDARTVQRARQDVIAVNRTFTDVFAVVLVLALLVALTSTAAGVTREARERRQEIGVLRTLGAARRHIVVLLVAGPMLTAGLGVSLGLAVGVALLRVLFAVGFSDLPFLLDLATLGAGVAAVLVLTLVTCTAAALPSALRPLEDDLADMG